MLVLATSSDKSILMNLGLFEHIDSDLRVPPVHNIRSLEYVLQEVALFPTSEECKEALRQLQQAGFAMRPDDEDGTPLQIGIKKLLTLVEMARQEPDNVSLRLTSALMGLGVNL